MTTSQQLRGRANARVDITWRDYARCRTADLGLFFPDTADVAVEEIEAAKTLCESCGVKSACLQFALETKQDSGIWGGTTEDERRRLRRAWLADRRRQAG